MLAERVYKTRVGIDELKRICEVIPSNLDDLVDRLNSAGFPQETVEFLISHTRKEGMPFGEVISGFISYMREMTQAQTK